MSKLADYGLRTLRRLRQWGIDVSPSSRLPRAVQTLRDGGEAARAGNEPSVEQREAIGEAARDCFEFYLPSHAQEQSPSPEIRTKWEQALKGAGTPRAETHHLARNTQFELYVWGLLTASGSECQFKEPPDLIARLGDHELSIAVKRVWSLRKAHSRLSEGARQVRASGMRGILAVNAQEFVTNPSHARLEQTERTSDVQRALERVRGHLPDVLEEDRVIGALLCGLTYDWHTDEARVTTFSNQMFHQLVLYSSDEAEKRSFLTLWSAQFKSLQKWADQNL